jgi:hypothetical protein
LSRDQKKSLNGVVDKVCPVSANIWMDYANGTDNGGNCNGSMYDCYTHMRRFP